MERHALSAPHPLTSTECLLNDPATPTLAVWEVRQELRRQVSNHSLTTQKKERMICTYKLVVSITNELQSILDGVHKNLSELKDGTKDIIQKTF